MYIDVIICHTSIICEAHYEGLYMLTCCSVANLVLFSVYTIHTNTNIYIYIYEHTRFG